MALVHKHISRSVLGVLSNLLVMCGGFFFAQSSLATPYPIVRPSPRNLLHSDITEGSRIALAQNGVKKCLIHHLMVRYI